MERTDYFKFALTRDLGGILILLRRNKKSLIAMNRRHQNAMAIFLLNLLLGWTALGWIVALIWSFTEVRPDTRRT